MKLLVIFVKMLTLEQYKSPEMSALYQKVLVSGPLEYIENFTLRDVKRTGETAALSPCIGNRVLFSLLSSAQYVRWDRL